MIENPSQLWRRDPDSSTLPEPRTFVRVFVEPGRLTETVACYERLLGVSASMFLPYPEKNLALASVGGFLLIEGSEPDLRPFRDTVGTLLVDAIDGYLERLRELGAEIIHPPVRVPSGAGFTARHPDGTVIEYVEHRPDEHGR